MFMLWAMNELLSASHYYELTCTQLYTPIGKNDMGQFNKLMRLMVTNAFSASSTWSGDDKT